MATATTGTGGVSDEGFLCGGEKVVSQHQKKRGIFPDGRTRRKTHDDNGDGLYDSLNRFAAGAPGGV